MTRETSIDELTKQLDESLDLDGKHTSQEATAAVDLGAAADEDSVSDDLSDGESTYSVPSAVGSLSSEDSSDDGIGRVEATGPAPPLTVHRPSLPVGVTSIFANTASTIDSIAEMIKTGSAKSIIVMAGAGISTDAGIPDFRSPGTGLYANLQKYRLPYPEAIFTIDYFRRKPKPFFVLAKELYPGQFVPTISHFFVKLLAKRGLLHRHYTQNIDCLERVAGVESDLIVEAHGSFHAAHCIGSKCRKEFPQDWVREKIFNDSIPHCDKCNSLVKPDITFFGEGLPTRFFDLLEGDFASCDLLIVMGTSLQVHPFAALINEVQSTTPRLLINRERVGESKTRGMGFDFDGSFAGSMPHRDALVLGDCDEACLLLADRLGWTDELLGLRAAFIDKRKLEHI
ncbi:NAD-dependent protein deacetylase sirtuin-2 [Coemansia sp. RSA 1822]|nr:NAD-dependent protein deacetylase sirtuin-2 [Coemansia sp. RSA 638]KAJ2122432.1 NAD-dependent protein deacetylase sirtuin-2 [Coemansia sp. RSA 720]KAJ2564998.1 NAD-dependent protein deacetylase sirtuin-2 [Coemansia sp. RSA 1822]